MCTSAHYILAGSRLRARQGTLVQAFRAHLRRCGGFRRLGRFQSPPPLVVLFYCLAVPILGTTSQLGQGRTNFGKEKRCVSPEPRSALDPRHLWLSRSDQRLETSCDQPFGCAGTQPAWPSLSIQAHRPLKLERVRFYTRRGQPRSR